MMAAVSISREDERTKRATGRTPKAQGGEQQRHFQRLQPVRAFFIPPSPIPTIMAQNPREHLERLQMMLRQRRGGGFGGIPGGPAPFRAGIALALLGVGALAVSESLFNGR